MSMVSWVSWCQGFHGFIGFVVSMVSWFHRGRAVNSNNQNLNVSGGGAEENIEIPRFNYIAGNFLS